MAGILMVAGCGLFKSADDLYTDAEIKRNNGKLAETIEIKEHPWFVACQFHPEFKSKPFQPHPLFVQFIKASSKKS